jgi:DNA-binding transcriptional ArsR family regulator
MDSKIQSRFDLKANVLKSLAHPTRLFIIDELAREERCVNDLTDLVGADMSTVSKHLSVLKNAGVVLTEKRGTQVYYSLRSSCVLHFFECIDNLLKERDEEERLGPAAP